MSASISSFVWYELLTTDMPAAEAFYRHVIGWGAHDAGMTDRRYTILTAGENFVGGLMALPKEVCDAGGQPGWIGYIGVDDVSAYAGLVQKAGGEIHRPPEDIPGVGRFAVASDPQDAAFVLFQGPPGQSAPSTPPGAPGHAGWHELHTANWEDAFAFYSALFGWRKADAVDMGPMGIYQLFTASAEPIGGMMTRSEGSPGPMWLFYWNVEHIDAAARRVTDRGGKVINGPHEVPGGSWVVQCLDPQGAMFALVAAQR